MKETLKKLGGWPVVEGNNWKPPRDSIEILLGSLRGEFNEGVLVEQWVGPDDKNSSANILQVRRQSKTVVGDLRFSSQRALKKFNLFIENILLLLFLLFIYFNYPCKKKIDQLNFEI